MEKITNLPLGEKFVRQSEELTAVLEKLKKPTTPLNHRQALEGARIVLINSLNKTMAGLSQQLS